MACCNRVNISAGQAPAAARARATACMIHPGLRNRVLSSARGSKRQPHSIPFSRRSPKAATVDWSSIMPSRIIASSSARGMARVTRSCSSTSSAASPGVSPVARKTWFAWVQKP